MNDVNANLPPLNHGLRNHGLRSARSTRGFVTMEALIASLVMCTGVVALTLLQVREFKQMRNATGRGVAVQLANSHADVVQSQLSRGGSLGTSATVDFNTINGLTAAESIGQNATPYQVQEQLWRREVWQHLGVPSTAVVLPLATQLGAYKVVVVWNERVSQAGESLTQNCPSQIQNLPVRARCIQVVVTP